MARYHMTCNAETFIQCVIRGVCNSGSWCWGLFYVSISKTVDATISKA